MNNRVEAGRTGKAAGHAFEHKLAEIFGGCVDGGSQTKVDIFAGGWGNLTIKNPSKNHTQVHLTSVNSFTSNLKVEDLLVREALDLLFGAPAGSQFDELIERYNIDKTKLDPHWETRRGRLNMKNINLQAREALITWMNDNTGKLFRVCFQKGYDHWFGEADTLGWAFSKSDVDSVEFYSMCQLRRTYNRGVWTVADSGTVLNLTGPNGEKFLHLQMKGSGQGWSKHSMMFHMYSSLLK